MASEWLSEFQSVTPQLRTYLEHRLSNPSDVDDILQQAAMELSQRANDVRGDQARALIMTIVRRRLFDSLRAEYRRRLDHSVPEHLEHTENVRLEARDLLRRMAELLGGLSTEQRELLARTWEGAHPFDRPFTDAERKQLERLRNLLKQQLTPSTK